MVTRKSLVKNLVKELQAENLAVLCSNRTKL